jgi:general secretion pathway protein K
MRTSQRQHGVAILVALVLMALVTIIAYDVWFAGALEQRRSFSVLSIEQGFQYGLGGEALAAVALQRDLQQSKQDYTAEEWAAPFPPFQIDAGEVQVGLEDMQARFNLNNLIDPKTGNADQDMVDQFRRLLEILGLEAKWAGLMVDWLDADLQPSFPDGAEDPTYTALAPPYLPPNGPITSTTELLALPGFGIERYRKIQPFVAALPVGTAINVCTAPGEVLDSLSATIRQFDANFLATQRRSKCFPALTDLQAALPPADWQRIQARNPPLVSDNTQYFRLTTVTTIGTAQITLYSLLQRNAGGQTRPILRSWGTD